MSREIKFKFWLGHTKKMTFPHTLAEIGRIINEFTVDIIPLQFTGLTDKNGMEIYEGDIVRHEKRTWQEDDGEEPTYDNTVSTIKYTDHGFWVLDEDFGWEGEGLWDWSEIKVIGNIYENPELL